MVLSVLLTACEKEELKTVPNVETGKVSDITSSEAKVFGEVADEGNENVTERGILFGDSPNLIANGTENTLGSGLGIFSKTFDGLQPGKTYYYQAYAINAIGSAYGEELNFMTNSEKPSLSTSSAINVSAFSVGSGGIVTDDGGSPVTSRGLVWNTAPDPTLDHSKTVDGEGLGEYASLVTGLLPNTNYFLRAYATNSIGTSYGNSISIQTLSGIISFGSLDLEDISISSAKLSGVITDAGGTEVSEKGFVWNDTENPTIENHRIKVEGVNLGEYTASIQDLQANTTYYVRSYAINSLGISYGSEKGFTTIELSTGEVKDRDGNNYKTVKIGSQWWMAENLRVTKYADGTDIFHASSSEQWDNLNRNPGYSYYDNDPELERIHGKIYVDWTLNECCICPAGWRLPTREDYNVLITFLGGWLVAGESLKSQTGWIGNDANGNNLSGFNGLPSGIRDPFGKYFGIGMEAGWWASGSYYLFLSSSDGRASVNVTTGFFSANWGRNIRCIRE